MSLIVQKYGGTSVGDVTRIAAVAERARACQAQGNQVVVVVSAMAGETDRLLGLAKEFVDPPRGRELDVLLSTGEQVTIALLAMALAKIGVKARSFTGGQVPITTDAAHNKARISSIERARIDRALGAAAPGKDARACHRDDQPSEASADPRGTGRDQGRCDR